MEDEEMRASNNNGREDTQDKGLEKTEKNTNTWKGYV